MPDDQLSDPVGFLFGDISGLADHDLGIEKAGFKKTIYCMIAECSLKREHGVTWNKLSVWIVRGMTRLELLLGSLRIL